jgi:hypothetical protein
MAIDDSAYKFELSLCITSLRDTYLDLLGSHFLEDLIIHYCLLRSFHLVCYLNFNKFIIGLDLLGLHLQNFNVSLYLLKLSLSRAYLLLIRLLSF